IFSGQFVVEPGGVVRAMFVPADDADFWRNYDSAQMRTTRLTRLQAKSLADSAGRAIIPADSMGALIDIGGKSGKGLVHIEADSHGASLQVRDESGRKVVQMHDEPTGASPSGLGDFAQ